MVPETSKTPDDECEEDLDSELERLESDLKEMGQKILEYRSTFPDQLKSIFLSVLAAQRPFLPQLISVASEENISREESSSGPEDPEAAEKLKLLNEKIATNGSAMPTVLQRMKDCIAKFDKLDSYNGANIHPVFKRQKTG